MPITMALPLDTGTRGRLPSLGTVVSMATDRQTLVLLLICVLMFMIFAFDIFTPPDDVSICFIYVILVSLSSFSYRGTAYWCAGLATILSGLGAFFHTPPETLSLVFFTNRTIAVAAQWLMAFLVTTRKDTEAMMRAEYEAERLKAETSRRFVDVLSHEIGTSLTVIDGQAFRIKKIIESEDVAGRSEKIRQAVRHIEDVVRQVQLASEVDQAKIQFRPSEIRLSELVDDVILQTVANRKLCSDIAGLPPVVWGSNDMLRQILDNLISNAIKYSPAETEISVIGLTQDDAAVISVIDRGRGIPEGDRAKLFEPYYRASNSRGVHGTGIGLYVVQRYIASHGGAIEIDSKLGAGTTVTIRIPIGQNPQDDSSAAAPDSVH